MYLISLYFDEGTNKKIQLYMEQIAQRTGNMAMIDGKVPPHITLSAFDMAEEEKAIASFTAMEQEFEKGQIFWCSVGMFLPHTIYLSSVLNAYLQKLSESVFSKIRLDRLEHTFSLTGTIIVGNDRSNPIVETEYRHEEETL